jgi:DNA polymerase III alpha subunit
LRTVGGCALWQRRRHIPTRHANPIVRHAIVDVEAFGRAKIVTTVDPRGKHEVRDRGLALEQASSWVKCWHPDVFCAALLNSQPMGFYAPAQIVRDAQAHGVEFRPICINTSRWDCTLEPTDDESLFAVRLGMRMVKGLANALAAAIVAARAERPFLSVDDLWRRAGVPSASLVQLAEADAFRPAMGLVRREALWAIKALSDEPLPLFAAAAAREDEPAAEIEEPIIALRPMTAGSEVVEDYGHVGLTLRRHPVAFLRGDLTARRIVTCTQARDARDGRWLEAAGLVLVRQRPGSAKGVMFITLEDETGIANLVVWPADVSLVGKMADGDLVGFATNSRLISSGTPCGCIFALLSASAMSKICWPSAGWTSPMKRSDDGC